MTTQYYNIFLNNFNNKLNLQTIDKNILIHKNTQRFRDFDKILLNDGLYYLNNEWQYVQITDNFISLRVKFNNQHDLLYHTIWINHIDTHNSAIKHYYYKHDEKQKKLICTIPIDTTSKVYDFIDILFYSGYGITEPYKFSIDHNKNIIVLKKGTIFKLSV